MTPLSGCASQITQLLLTRTNVELALGGEAYVGVDEMCAKACVERGHRSLALEVTDDVFPRMQPFRASICKNEDDESLAQSIEGHEEKSDQTDAAAAD